MIGRRAVVRFARLAVSAANSVDQTVPAHRVPDEPCAIRVHETAEKTSGSCAAEPRHLVEHEELIERPVVERAREGFLIVVRAVLVIDRRHDESLARQVFREMAQQKTVARIAVRNDHEREGRRGRLGCGVAHRFAVQGGGDSRITRDDAVVALGLLSGGELRRDTRSRA